MLNIGKLVTYNIVLLLGGVVANVFSLAINFILLKTESNLANLYVIYNGITLIISFPSTFLIRIFNVYGEKLLLDFILYAKERLYFLLVLFLSLTSLITYSTFMFITGQDIFIAINITLLAIVTIVVYILRGIQNHKFRFINTMLSLNIETGGRLLTSLVLGIFLNMGIYGVMFGALITMLLSLVPLIEKDFFAKFVKHLFDQVDVSYMPNVKSILLSSLLFSFAIELIFNFETIFTLMSLSINGEKSIYNLLQIIKKILFHGSVLLIPLVLSLGHRLKKNPYLTFFYTIISGLLLSTCLFIFFYITRDYFLDFFNLASPEAGWGTVILLSMVSNILFVLGYLTLSWLFSQERFTYCNILSILNVIVLPIIFYTSYKDLEDLLKSSLLANLIFFLSALILSIIHLTGKKYEKLKI